LHARADLAQEHFTCLGRRRLSPEEFSGKHAPTWFADADEFPHGTRAVDEHRDGLGDHTIEAVVGKVQRENIAVGDGDLSGKPCAPDIGASTGEHDGRDVDCGHRRPEAAGDRNRRCADPTASIQDLLTWLKVRPLE
jgi:hypothetical protein